MGKSEANQLTLMFNLLAEARMNAYVDMVKSKMPLDQVKQYCEVMLERALKTRGVVT